jgi:hypothetical protein
MNAELIKSTRVRTVFHEKNGIVGQDEGSVLLFLKMVIVWAPSTCSKTIHSLRELPFQILLVALPIALVLLPFPFP